MFKYLLIAALCFAPITAFAEIENFTGPNCADAQLSASYNAAKFDRNTANAECIVAENRFLLADDKLLQLEYLNDELITQWNDTSFDDDVNTNTSAIAAASSEEAQGYQDAGLGHDAAIQAGIEANHWCNTGNTQSHTRARFGYSNAEQHYGNAATHFNSAAADYANIINALDAAISAAEDLIAEYEENEI